MTQTVVQFRGQARATAAAGTRLSDVYEIEEMIAAGGMGEIYRGKLIETGDPVAIKMIKPEFAENESVLALFRKEASALHRLHHDSIVRYYVFSVDRKLNRPYLAMEFVEGETLSEILRTRTLTLEEVDRFRRRIAAGLQVAHDQGIIHRDISPDNFILTDNDVRKAKIIDFGIARSTKLGAATVIGDGFAGKYNYVSPEQLGMHGGDVTNRSDIYSLGLVLAECLLGKAIDMGGSQFEVVDKRRAVPDLSGVDARLRPLIERMLQPDPKDRPESMTEVVEWTWEGRPGSTTLHPGAPQASAAMPPVAPAKGGNSGLMIGGGVAALAVAAAVGWFALQPKESVPAANPTAPAERPAPPVAALAARPDPLAQRPPPTTPAEQTERILHYIRYYDGDPCLLLHPVSVTGISATIEATASNAAAFRDFVADFRTVNGFEPTMATSEITPQQCKAIDLVLRLDALAGRELTLKGASGAVRRGERTQLQIDGQRTRVPSLISVNEDGTIRDLTKEIKASGGGATFDGRLDDGQGRAGRKLVIAFAGPRRIAALDRAAQLTSDQLLKALHDELAPVGEGLAIATRTVRID
jgi:eukaryotic-like serine/threonine-protein kinase